MSKEQGRRPELTGGGLISGLGGWSEIKKIRLECHDRIKGDQRILGDENFVDAVFFLQDEKYSHQHELAALGYNFDMVAEKVAAMYNIAPDDVLKKGNCLQGTESSRDQPSLRMTNTLRQPDRENLRHPVNSYKYGG